MKDSLLLGGCVLLIGYMVMTWDKATPEPKGPVQGNAGVEMTYGIGRAYCPWTERIYLTSSNGRPQKYWANWEGIWIPHPDPPPEDPDKKIHYYPPPTWGEREFPTDVWNGQQYLDTPNRTAIFCGAMRQADALNEDRSVWRCGHCRRKFDNRGNRLSN